jgi:hypothetical protein
MPSASGRDGLIDAVNNSSVYGRNVLAEPVTDVDGLKGYLLKEATPQAAFRTGLRRVKGSHPLAEGGDRVRLSPALRDTLIRAERVTPYQRTYAARRPKVVAEVATDPVTWLFYADGQGLLLDVAATSPPAKSLPLPTPRPKRPPSPPTMFSLFDIAPGADLIETMKTLGSTHRAIAERIGISRPQVTNIINRQFGPSSSVVRRVLDLAKAA